MQMSYCLTLMPEPFAMRKNAHVYSQKRIIKIQPLFVKSKYQPFSTCSNRLPIKTYSIDIISLIAMRLPLRSANERKIRQRKAGTI
jgi:hypothetical protein